MRLFQPIVRWLAAARPSLIHPRARYALLEELVSDTLTRLDATTEPVMRARLLALFGDQLRDLARVTIDAFGHETEPFTRTLADDARLAAVVAEAELAGARRRPRIPSDWAAVERHGAGLLDQLAETDISDDATRAQIYAVLQAAVRPALSTPARSLLLDSLEYWHTRRADGQ